MKQVQCFHPDVIISTFAWFIILPLMTYINSRHFKISITRITEQLASVSGSHHAPLNSLLFLKIVKRLLRIME